MPRRRLLTPQLSQAIASTIAQGVHQETAARAAGISPAAYWKWLARGRAEIERIERVQAELDRLPKRGHVRERRQLAEQLNVRDDERVYVEFVEEIERARAAPEVHAVTALQCAIRAGNVRAILGFLERRFPDRWGRTTTTRHAGPTGGPVEVQQQAEQQLELDFSGLNPEQRRLAHELLEAAAGVPGRAD